MHKHHSWRMTGIWIQPMPTPSKPVHGFVIEWACRCGDGRQVRMRIRTPRTSGSSPLLRRIEGES